MRRFFVSDESQLNDETVELTGDEFHHLVHVSRLEKGERVELLDGKGRIALAQIDAIGKKAAVLSLIRVSEPPPPPKPLIEIILALPRFQKMDLIIQKSVELGAERITPVFSERSFVKKISSDLIRKRKRWEAIAKEACKQSGRAWPLEIGDFATLSEVVETAPKEESLFLYEGEGEIDIHSALNRYKTRPEKILVFIGAEGGFSPFEVDTFKSKSLTPITLGPLVLRVETACIVLLSVIQYHFDLMR